MKTCIRCGETKHIEDYYVQPRMTDGRLGRCKECHKECARQRHHEKMLDPEWRESERRRGRAKWRKNRHKWTQAKPQQRAAHYAVSNAVRDGRISPPDQCEDCGHDFTEFRREAHHEDYSKPLDIAWLCSLCHGKRHRRTT